MASAKRMRSVATTAAEELVAFINASPSPFHATLNIATKLSENGFTRLSEKDDWSAVVKPGGKYFVTRNESAIVGFVVGDKYKPGNGFNMIGAHTDSPCLKVKPIHSLTKCGYQQVDVETYGGGLWNTWFDRDLGVAGRVVVATDDGKFKTQLVRVRKPIMRISNLAIHLNRTIYTDGFKYNKETHLAPILSTAAKAELEGAAAGGGGGGGGGGGAEDTPKRHHPVLMTVLANELGVKEADIRDYELCLYDTQDGVIGGALDEFVFAARLDNLAMCYTGTTSLVNAANNAKWLADETSISMVACFDNEEVGSESLMGAAGPFLKDVMTRITKEPDVLVKALRASFMISADMAHGLHPNYPEKHGSLHKPMIHKGVVIKQNCNQRYATSAVTMFILRELGKRNGVPIQDFVARQDMGCGTTIGPIMSGKLGVRTVDVGCAQFSMHSIREMCGADDVDLCVKLFTAFYEQFTALDASLATAE